MKWKCFYAFAATAEGVAEGGEEPVVRSTDERPPMHERKIGRGYDKHYAIKQVEDDQNRF